MKKLIKHGALFTALFVTMLMVSCPAPVGKPKLDGVGYKPPAGMGAVRLVVNGEKLPGAKTIIPGVTLASFQSYKLTFTATAGYAYDQLGSTPVVEDFVGNNTALAAATFDLIPGTYSLVTLAYVNDSQSGQAAAAATNGTVIVAEGAPTTIGIALTASAVTSTSGPGTFGWNIGGITGPGAITGLTTATMAIVPLNGGTDTWSTATPVNLMTAGNANTTASPYTLTSGYYDVIFELDNGTSTFEFGQVLWVYAGMPSIFAFDFKDAHFGVTLVTVTFNYLDGTTTNATRSCLPNATLGSNLPTEPTRAGYTFLGWWGTNGSAGGGSGAGWGSQFTASTNVTVDTTVFARWLEDGELNPGSGVTFTPIGGTDIEVWASTLLENGDTVTVANAGTLVLTIANFTDFDSVEWKYNTTSLGTTNTITLNTGTTPSTGTNGEYPMFIRAILGGEYQSAFFIVKVAP